MKKRLPTVFLILIFVAGILVMFYPTISNWYNQRMSSYVVSNYTKEIDNKSEEEYDAIMEEAREYNQKLNSLPTNFISGVAESQEYIDTLNVLNGMMGYLKIEKINVNLPIYHGTDEGVLQKYVGHLEGSSLPTGDEGNNTVLTGHTGLPTAELLTDLIDMEIGDTFEVVVLNQTFTYEVFNIVVVEPHEVDDLEAIAGKDIVTLVTCTPYGINSHRLLVQGQHIEVYEEPVIEQTEIFEEPVVSEPESEKNLYVFVPVAIFSIVIVLLIYLNIYVYIHNAEYRKNQKKLKK